MFIFFGILIWVMLAGLVLAFFRGLPPDDDFSANEDCGGDIGAR